MIMKLFPSFRVHLIPRSVLIEDVNSVGKGAMQFLQFMRIRCDTSVKKGPCPPRLSISVAHDWTTFRGPQYEPRLERKRTVRACVRACVRKRIKRKPGKGGSRNKMKKKTKTALKRKVGARIETQFDPRYEAPAEVGSPRAHLTWMRWQALSDMFSCTRALALSLIACINAFPACTRRLSGLPLSPCRLFPERNSFNVP